MSPVSPVSLRDRWEREYEYENKEKVAPENEAEVGTAGLNAMSSKSIVCNVGA